MIKDILCHANGGEKIGYGHLYRLTRFISSVGLISRALFLAQNSEEKDFLTKNGFEVLENNRENKGLDFKLFLIDSKVDFSNYYKNYVGVDTKRVYFDSFEKWSFRGSKLIIPSFFINEKFLNSLNEKEREIISWGKEYVILSQPVVSKKKLSKNILLTFGGSDPNNLTLRVLETLKDTRYMSRVRVILGPGYKDNIQHLYSLDKKINIVRNAEQMQKEIANSSIIFSALGVTLQEAEYYGKKTAVLFNYEVDRKDFHYLKKYSKNKNLWKSIGMWNQISKETVLSTIDYFDDLKEGPIDLEAGWGNNLTDIIKKFL